MTTSMESLEERVRLAVMQAWPDLAEEAVTAVGLDVGRLSEILQRELGRDAESALNEARAAFTSALLPAQAGNAGWVEVLSERDEAHVARGQLYLYDTSPDSSGSNMVGAITHLRVSDETQPLAAGTYLARFEENGETRPIAAVTEQSAMLPDMIAIVFLDDGLPISVSELSEGD